jgi:seryl-tRNA synthetase
MSRKPYECFRCRDNGFPNTQVYLAGKDEQGKTIQLEEDGTKHVHKTQQKQQDNNLFAPVSDESVERGIDALFNLMTSLIKEVEEVKEEIKHVREVLGNQERLFNQMLVWVQQMKKQQQHV